MGFRQISPSFHAPIIDLISDLSVRRRMLQAFRGSFKSSIATIGLSCWLMAREMALRGTCNQRILIGSERLHLAGEFCAAIGQTASTPGIFSDLYGNHKTGAYLHFPGRKRSTRWHNTIFTSAFRSKLTLKDATISSTSVDSPRAGGHFDALLFDDLQAQTNANTLESIEKVWTFFKLQTPLLDPQVQQDMLVTPSGLTVIEQTIQQLACTRWHFDDIYHRIMDLDAKKHESDRYKTLILPAEDQDGLPTFPERFPREKLDKILTEIGPDDYARQYLLQPLASSERKFSPDWIRYVTREEARRLLETRSNVYVTADLAYTEQSYIDAGRGYKNSDYTVIFTVVVDEFWNYYIVDAFRERVSKLDAVEEIFRQANFNNALATALQRYDRSMIDETIQQYAHEENEYIYYEYVSYPSRKTKNDRIVTALQGLMRQGKIFILEGLSWLEEEFIQFPLSRHDDGLDALCNVIKISSPDAAATDEREERSAGEVRSLIATAADLSGSRKQPTWDTL